MRTAVAHDFDFAGALHVAADGVHQRALAPPPFVPMSPTISSAPTSKETSSTAVFAAETAR